MPGGIPGSPAMLIGVIIQLCAAAPGRRRDELVWGRKNTRLRISSAASDSPHNNNNNNNNNNENEIGVCLGVYP